jgi:Universal stress protein family
MPVVPVMKDPERAVETALELVEEATTVTALYVIEVSPLLPLDAPMLVEEEHARRFLRRAASVGKAHGIRVVPRLIRARDAATAIRMVAEEEDTAVVIP